MNKVEQITDEKLLKYGFIKNVSEYITNGETTVHVTFYKEYNYYLHNTQRVVLMRQENSKYKFPQFKNTYTLKIESINKSSDGLIIRSVINDWKILENLWLALTDEKLIIK